MRRQAFFFLALNGIFLVVASRFIGWTGAIFAVALWSFLYWLATRPDKPPSSVAIAAERHSLAEELPSMKLAYKLAGRPSHMRRIFTIASVVAFCLFGPISLLLQVVPYGDRFGEFGGVFVLAFAMALITEGLKDSRFRRKAPELHERFSIWAPVRGNAQVAAMYREAVRQRWLKGKDPDWHTTEVLDKTPTSN